MQVQVENVNPVTKRIKVTLSKEKVKSEVETLYRELQKTVTVKGFRKGKAPRNVLERLYKPRIDADVIQSLVRESYPKVIEEQKLAPVASPVIHESELKEGEDFSYTATVEVRPEFELPNYKGLAIAASEKSVSDADIDEQLKLLRERKATLVPMLEDRALALGDFAIIDYETFIAGSSQGKTEDTTVKVGDGQLLDEFEKTLPGLKVGETRSVDVDFPADHGNEQLAGKKVLYRVTLKDIKRQDIPELSEEFAKEVGAESLEDLKTKIRTELEGHRKEERKREIRGKILDQILEKLTMEIPPAMLDRQLRALYQSAQQVIGESGKALDRGGFDSLKDGLKTQAERRVRELLVLESIARVENLQVSEEDLNAQFEQVAQRYGQSAASVRAYYLQEGRINSLVNVLAEEKALDFLEKASTITG